MQRFAQATTLSQRMNLYGMEVSPLRQPAQTCRKRAALLLRQELALIEFWIRRQIE